MITVEYISHKEQLAQRIRCLRMDQDISTRTFADMIGISKSYLYSLEHAKASPTFEMMERLAAGFGISVIELIDFD